MSSSRSDRPRGARLIVEGPGGRRTEVRLDRDRIIVGRDASCDLVLEDRYVSRRHAIVHLSEDGWLLSDEGSRNGVFLRGKRLDGPHRLSDGDELRIGESSLRFSEGDLASSATAILPPAAQPATEGLVLDADTRDVWVEGNKIEPRLSPLEFKLLAYLYSRPGYVCPREELCVELWGQEAYSIEMLHQVVHRVKQRIEPEPRTPRYLVTVPGIGYQLVPAGA